MAGRFTINDEERGQFFGEVEDKHYASIGQLVSEFAGLEVSIVLFFRMMLAIPYPIARQITAGGRATNHIELIRRIIPLVPATKEIEPELIQILSDISDVKKVRDIVAHQPFAVRGDEMAFTTTWNAKTLPGETTFYSVGEIRECAEYCLVLSQMLKTYWSGPVSPDTFKAEELNQAIAKGNQERRDAWQRKPAVLSKTSHKAQRPAPKNKARAARPQSPRAEPESQ